MKADIGRVYAPTDLLFGDDLQKDLKGIGDQNKIGATISFNPSKGQAGGSSHSGYSSGFRQGLNKHSKNFQGRSATKHWKNKQTQDKPNQFRQLSLHHQKMNR